MLSRALALLGSVALGLESAVATAVGQLAPRTAADRAQSRTVPIVAAGLIALGSLPLAFAGLELIIHRTTAAELVDRITGPSIQLVELNGLAQLPPFVGPPRENGTPTSFYLVRDSASERDLVVVRTELTPDALLTREVTGVIVDDPERVAAGADALASRGIWAHSPLLAALGGRYVREDPAAADAQSVSVDELADLAPAAAVRMRLRFTGRAVHGCGSIGDAVCDARALAGGRAQFDHLATDATTGAPVLVRTANPTTLVPIRVFGTQQTDRALIEQLFATPAGTALGTWGRELRTAWIDRDPGLPVDRPWIAPTLLIGPGLLLLIGRRIGYPIFRSTDGGVPARGGGAGTDGAWPSAAMSVIVTGRLSRPANGPIDVDRVGGRLMRGADDILAALEVETATGRLRSTITHAMRGMSVVERGDLVRVLGREPALALHWFGNDVVLAFRTDAERDRAAALLSG